MICLLIAAMMVGLGLMRNNNNILEIYTYLMVQTESLNATASAALPPERLKQTNIWWNYSSIQLAACGASCWNHW
jgi:hypothetical protein